MCRSLPLLVWRLLAGTMLGAPLSAQVVRVTVEPAAATLIAGNALQFRATAFDATGRPVPNVRVNWAAMPDDAVTVDSLGIVRAWHPAEARITALVAGISAGAVVRIEPRDPATVEVQTEQEVIPVGGTTRLVAMARDADLAPLDGTVFTYRSSDDRVATVNPAGVVTGRAEGSVIFAVQVGALRREVPVRVVAARVARLSVSGPAQARVGDIIRLRAIAEDRRNLPVANPPVQWSVADPGASVDRDGAFLAERPGTYRIVATSAAAAGTHTVRVIPRPVPTLAEVLPAGPLRSVRVVALGQGVLYAIGLANQLYVYDLTDASAPRVVDSLLLSVRRITAMAVDVERARLVVTGEGDAGLTILGLRDPRRPVVLAAVRRDGLGAAAVSGAHAYLAEAGTGALRVVGLEVADAPKEVAVWRLTPPTGVDMPTHRVLSGITVAGGLAYLAYGRDGVVVLDVGHGIRGGSPERPRLVSQLVCPMRGRYPAAMRVGVRQTVRVGEYLFLAEQAELAARDAALPQWGTVRVVRVRDLLAPELVGSYDAGSEVRHLAATGDTLLVSAGPSGVRLVDIHGDLRGELAAQSREFVLAPVDDPWVVGSVRAGQYLYLADLRRGVRVVRLPGEAR